MIREAKREDLAQLLALYHAVEKTPSQDSVRAAEIFEKLLEDPDYHIIVAEEGERVVSTCTCVVIPNLTSGQRPYTLVENVATMPPWQRKGLASACMKRAKEIAAANGCYKIYLTTSSKDEGVWRFYENLGYNRNDKTTFIQRL